MSDIKCNPVWKAPGAYQLHKFRVNGEDLDALELKILLITQGINVPVVDVYEQFSRTHRLSPDPLECSCLLLPGNIVVHLTAVGLQSPFNLRLSDRGEAYLDYNGEFVTEVSFPPATRFYAQQTSSGRPFRGLGVLQGVDILSFAYLWSCEYAQTGLACQFCHTGGYTEQLFRVGQRESSFPTPQDVAEVVEYAVNTENVAKHIQITGGSTMNPQAECDRVTAMLNAIDAVTGCDKIPGEILIYTTPPTDPVLIDDVFAAGADRVACDIEVWDENLARQICPGKARLTGRQRHLDTLQYIAEKFGPNKACSAFVVGVEPLASFLAGAEYLAQRGIVPIVSIWMPHGRPVLGKTEAPSLGYYRQVRDRIAELYVRYDIEPPGGAGFNVCLCRDTWNHKAEILEKKELNFRLSSCKRR